MREQVFQVPPQAPMNLAGVAHYNGNLITFTDMALSETGFTLERATNAGFTTNVKDITLPASAGWNNTVTYLDSSVVSQTNYNYYYRIRSFKPDADYWMPLIGTTGTNGAPLPNLVSAWIGPASFVVAPIISVAPMALNFGVISQTSGPQSFTVSNVGVGSLAISSMKIVAGASPNSFAVTGNTCTTTLAAGATCRVTIVLNNTVKGVQSANFVIASSDPANPTVNIPLTGTMQTALTITAGSAAVNWGTGVPTITPTVVGLIAPDTVASLAITCSTTYTATSNAGTYPTSCTAGSNPSNKYIINYVNGRLTVNPVVATMISPTPGLATILTNPQTFTWTTGGAAQIYGLWVSAQGPGLRDVYNNPQYLYGTSVTVTIPATDLSRTLYVRLWTYVSGAWQYLDYTYTAPPPMAAVLTNPLAGPLPASVTFQWTPGAGLIYYALSVSAIGPGQSEIYKSGYLSTTSQQVINIPQGKTIYVRLYSIPANTGAWLYNDYTF